MPKPVSMTTIGETIGRREDRADRQPDSPRGKADFRPDDLADEFDHDGDLLKVVLEAVRESLPEMLAQIEQGLAGSDAAAVARDCHGLRGLALTITADRLAETSQELETLANLGQMAAAHQGCARLRDDWSRLLSSIEGFERSARW